MTADPYRASGGAADPQSWNRYPYAGNDPANQVDPSGLYHCLFDSNGLTDTYLDCGAYVSAQDGGDAGGGIGPTISIGGIITIAFGLGGGGGGGTPPKPAPPPCFVELKYRSVPGAAGANHAYLWVEAATGLIAAIEGFPDKPSLVNAGYLRAWTSPNGRLGTNAVMDSEWGSRLDASNDPQICNQADRLFNLSSEYDSDPVPYHAIGGPNSNSLAHWLLIEDGLDSFFSAPPGTAGLAGWNTAIPR